MFGKGGRKGGARDSTHAFGRGRGKGGRGKGGWGGGGGRGTSGQQSLPNKVSTLEGHQDTVAALAVSHARSQLFSGSGDGTVKIWDWSAGFKCVHTLQVGAPVEALLVEGDWLFAGTATSPGGRNGFVKAWNMADGREQTLEGHTGAVFCVAQGGPHLFSAGEDAGVKTWKFGQSGQLEPVVELQGHRAPIQALSVAADSLLSADRNGEVKAWDLDTGGCKLTLKTDHLSMVMAMWVEESWGAPCIFTAALDGHCKVWDAAGSLLHDQHVTNQHGESSGITSLLVLKEPGEEQVLVTACQDNALKLWRMPGFSRRGILASRAGHSDIVRCLAKGPGASFFSGSMDRSIIVWEFRS